MATPQQINDLVGLYVAYFDRAPDPEGLQFWITQLDNGRAFNTIAQDFARSTEAREIYPFLSTPDLVLNSSQAFITSIYANLFGRTPDQEGLDFWTLAINSGAVAPGDMVEAIMLGAQDTLVNGQLIQDKTIVANKIECALMWTEAVVDIEGFQFDAEAYAASRAAIDGVGADQASVDAAKLVTQQYINEFATVSNFALQQATMDVVLTGDDSISQVSVDTLMWGNPETQQGIPVSEFFAPGGYFSLIASQQFAGVAEIDVDADVFSIIDFSSVDTISLTGTTNITGNAGGGGQGNGTGGGSVIDTTDVGGIITFSYTDGSTDDIVLGQAYYDLLTELMFVDADNDTSAANNTRFFTQTTNAQVPVYVTADGSTTTVASEGVGEPIGYVNAQLVTPGAETVVTIDVPLILTTTANNDSTTFFGYTSADNDVIVAPTLDLLHAAYIDAGLGQNTLEIDAKGHFAQPKALLNIQTINIHNLPNIYAEPAPFMELNADGTAIVAIDGYPNYINVDGDALQAGSIIDLTRATALESLTITEGDYLGLNTPVVAGGLNVVGMRNDATLTLQGAYTENLYVQTGQGNSGDGFTVILENVNAENNMFIAQNSPKLNLVSEGGANYINSLNENENFEIHGNVVDLIISGSARLFIEDNLAGIFEDDTPVTIDASANTGGVDLNIEGGEFITFVGSKADDRFSASTRDDSDTSQGPDYGLDSAITITNTAGDNYYDVETKELTLTDADGNITVKADAQFATITLGDGDSQIGVSGAEVNVTAGDGDNDVEVRLENPTAVFVIDGREFDKSADIVLGDGGNTVRIDVTNNGEEVADVNVTAGNGGNTVEVTQTSGSATQTAITINTGTGADTIVAEGSEINITSGGGNDDITIVGTDNDYASDSVDIEADDSGVSVDGNDVISRGFNDGVLLNIDTGAGSATITLGVEGEDDSGFAINNVIAKEGSVITGTDITLNVNTYANLIAADVSGVTSVVLDDDAGNRRDSAQANDLYNGERAQLTVTMDQFLAIGADNMSVEGAIFNTQAFVKIIVTESTSLAALGVNDLPRNIDLYIEIADGATLTMTAEELHTRIARDGITLADDGNTDLANGNVVITGGGINFDPFNSNDTVQTNINGQVYFGGSISTNDFSDGNGNYVNVTVQSVFGPAGYNRPSDVISEVVLTIDSDSTPVVDGFDTFHSNVEIVGDADITFTDALNLGLFQGASANLFTIDFSELGGEAIGLTIGNFETVEQVIGNGIPGTEVFVEISADADDAGSQAIGFDDDQTAVTGVDQVDDRALISSGVSQYTVTVIGNNAGGDTATIRLCDKTEDLEVLAFRGNYNDTLVILDAAWGLVFDLEGGSTRKVDGPTGTSNVGTLEASFEHPGAPAVINIFQADDADNRPIDVAGIDLTNAGSLEINADGPAATITDFSIDDVTSLDLNADGDLEIEDIIDVDGGITIDASGVVGSSTLKLNGEAAGDFTYTGGASADTLTLLSIDDDGAEGVTIDGGAGGVALIIQGSVDLDESTLTNINTVTLTDGSSLSLQITDADAIGPDNFLIANGDAATLNLAGLGEDPFAIADYADGITVNVVSLADLPEITLHPDTDLTGIAELMVPEGTILNLTAEQFQQLDGAGTITGEGGTTNFTVSITDWTQASTDDGIDLSGVTADTFTITMAEDIALGDSDDLGTADVVMADGLTITVPEITQIDGTNFSGGVDTTINITDDTFTGPAGVSGIDASGFDVDLVRITNVLAADRNVDALLDGIPERATKEIYNTLNFVDGVTQNVVLFEGTTIPGGVGFIPLAAEIELRIFNLYMEGGTEIDGTLRLFQSDAENGLLQNDLQEVNIFSTNPTAVNALSGDTGNVIDGDINAFPGGGNPTFDENDLLNVNISGDADFTLTGDLRFNSVVGLGLGANDNEDATATLTVNSTANTVIGEIDTSDADVIAVEITNAGTGNLTVGINSANIDADDAITFTGSATGYDKISVQGNVDFSDDTLTDVDELEFDSDATNPTTITVTQAQFDDIGVAGFTTTEDDDFDNNNAILNLVEFGAAPFDATALDADINLGSITMAAGDITLDPTTDLTGVSEIFVPEGGSITLTAAQFQQLDGNGTIVSVDGVDPDAVAGPITINITDLTQADIDGGSFVLSDIVSGEDLTGTDPVYGAVNLSLAESVELSDDDVLATGNAGEVDVTLTDGQDLGLALFSQADGLNVVGTGTTNVFFRFEDDDGAAVTFATTLDASGYDVTQLHALNTFLGGRDVEFIIDELNDTIVLVIYQDPTELGILNSVNRVVIVEPGVTVPGIGGVALAFNDLDPGDEVVTLTMTLSGGSILDGDLRLDTVTPPTDFEATNFKTLTLNSIGDGVTENLLNGGIANVIDGDISTVSPGPFNENNLLEVVINADQALNITGEIAFNKIGDDTADTDDDEVATLTVNGTADTNIGEIDTSDADVTGIEITNAGTGGLTVGISDANVDAGDTISYTGSAVGYDKISVEGTRDFSGDTLSDIDEMEFDSDSTDTEITVTQAQFDDIGAAGFTTTEDNDDDVEDNATLNLTQFGSDPFDGTAIDADINLGTITMAPGVNTLDPTTDLTGVDAIIVPEGGTLNLTAAQFQQLEGNGTITSLDGADADAIAGPITVNITDLTQADIDAGSFVLTDVDTGMETIGPDTFYGPLTVSLAESVELSDDDNLETGNAGEVEVLLADGQDLGLALFSQADGLNVTGTGITDVFFRFDDNDGAPVTFGTVLDAEGYSVTQLHALNVFLGGRDVEFLLDQLASEVTLVIYHDPETLGFISQTNRVVIVEPGVTVPGIGGVALAFNDLSDSEEVVTLTMTLSGGSILDGDIQLDTVLPPATELAANFQTLTLISTGDGVTENLLSGGTANIIDGDIVTDPSAPPPFLTDNNLLNVIIVADQELQITGTIFFNNIGDDEEVATLTTSGAADITIKGLDANDLADLDDAGISGLVIDHTGTGTLTITGGSDAIEANNLTDLTFTGTGNIVLDTAEGAGDDGIDGGATPSDVTSLNSIDSDALTGDLTMGLVKNVSSEDFSVDTGTGVTTMTLGSANLLDSTAGTAGDLSDDTAGWNFDFSDSAAGSMLTFGPGVLPAVAESSLSFDMGADAVLKIAQDLDLTELNFSFTGTQAIELLDGVELTLTAAQADGLTIIRCDDGDDLTDPAVVNIIDLGNDPVDLSGIDAEIAGAVRIDRDVIPETLPDPTVLEDDVTLDIATDLGAFTVELLTLTNDNFNLSGQTIRFTTEEQAAREIDVVFDATEPGTVDPAADGDNTNSSNVAFLFETISGQVDTSGYDEELGRVWVSAALVNSEGGDIENIFTTLPNSIIRVDFNTVTELDFLLASAPINRVIELTSFTNIVGLTEIDDDDAPEEHIETLNIRMGGSVTVGDIIIGDVVAAADTDPLTPEFDFLRINSHRALSDQHFLATEDYVNNNDGIVDLGESAQPDAVNTVGNIEVGGTNLGIDLIDVRINTRLDSDPVVGTGYTDSSDSNAGADFVFETLTFDSEGDDTTTGADEGEGSLSVTGENDVTGKAIDASDAEITSVSIDVSGHTGTLTFTGGSPAFFGGEGTEELEIDNNSSTDGIVNFGGTITLDDMSTPLVDEFSIDFNLDGNGDPYAGIAGEDLSLITTDDHGGTVNLGVIAQIDGDSRVTDDFGMLLPAADAEGFRIDNAVGSTGVGEVYACFGEANVNGVLLTPTLTATGEVYIDGGATGPRTVFLELKDVDVEAGGKITLIGTEVTVTGDIDLTDIAVEDFVIVNSTLMVAEDGILSLTVEQVTGLQAAGIVITGSGTVVVTGASDDSDFFVDPTDVGTDTNFSNLQTATVDLSAVTLAATDGNDAVDITASGATGDDGMATTQTIIGTVNNDAVTIAASADDSVDETIDVITQLGADSGDIGVPAETPSAGTPVDATPEVAGDTVDVTSFFGQVQMEVDAGFDAVNFVVSGSNYQVAAGAEFYGENNSALNGGFVATAETSNDGTAVIETQQSGLVLDLSAATGSEGWTLIGNTDGSTDTIVGSAQDDIIIDGLASGVTNTGEEDTFTGGDGADNFVFNFATTTPADLTDTENNPALDEETITVLADTADDGSEALVINYAVGNTVGSLTVNDATYNAALGVATGIDFSDAIAISAAVAAMLDQIAGITAVSDGVNTVTLTGDNGERMNIQTPVGVVGDDTLTAVTADAGTDTAQDNTVLITGGGSSGELYSLTVQLSNGTDIEATYLATGTETPTMIANGLIADFNAASGGGGGGILSAALGATTAGTAEILLQDLDADDGGFGVTVLGATTSVGAASSSSLLDGFETSLADADADTITDFMTVDGDLISFGLAIGSNTNYGEEASQIDFVTAQANADAAFAGNANLIYFLSGSDADATGLLFLNVDGDTDADAVVALTGINSTNFDEDQIV